MPQKGSAEKVSLTPRIGRMPFRSIFSFDLAP
jgi:hypothetical protein